MSFPQGPFQSKIQAITGIVETVWQQWFQQIQERLNASSLSGPTSARPTTGLYVGMSYFDTTLNKPVYWNGSTWITW